jgi:hypothetical protein
MRYEIKYNIKEIDLIKLKYLLKTHPYSFKSIYRIRQVNNIYFDTINFQNYVENIEGEKDRKKYRIRWYDDFYGICKDPYFEIKYKSGSLGWKDKLKILTVLDIKKNQKLTSNFESLLKQNHIKSFIRNYQLILPTLLNSYRREYFISHNERFRITVDSNLQYFDPKEILNENKISMEANQTILEIKFEKCYYEELEKVTNFFPFRITKSSKYIMGVQKTKCLEE